VRLVRVFNHSMSGTTDLKSLLRSMAPVVAEQEYVFTTLKDPSLFEGIDALCMFREKEAITAICPKACAEEFRLPFDGTYRQITLTVHSSLQAVGFLAAVSSALAQAGIPCNVVSAFYHDHIFVPAASAPRAASVLASLARESEDA
jgi:uncharacterized protein